MRRFTNVLLILYATLPVIIILRASSEARFPLWPAMLLPLVGFAFTILCAGQALGRRRALLFLGLTLAISLAFESLSVAYGWVYGPYHYSPTRLGPLFAGLVPYIIPLTWFLMLYPAYIIADRLIPSNRPGALRTFSVAALGGLVMLCWDLVLDPLMTAKELWFWEKEGVYFGIPLQNYWGWWLTAFLILAIYQVISNRLTLGEPQGDWMLARLAVIGYAVTGVGNIAEAWQLGLWAPALIGAAAMAPWVLLGWRATAHFERAVPGKSPG